MATAIENSIRFFRASWTATSCSARLPIVGMRITPTKNGVRSNVATNGSIAPTSISDSTASSAAARQQHADRRPSGPRRAAVTLGRLVAAERRAGFVNW